MSDGATHLIELVQGRYTLAQACEITGCTTARVFNWQSRGLVKLGRTHSLFGRSVLSRLDVIRLAAMVQLQTFVNLAASDSAIIADVIVQFARGETLPFRLLLLQRNGETGEWLAAYGEIPAAGPAAPNLRPHLIVPVAEMVNAVLRRCRAFETSNPTTNEDN